MGGLREELEEGDVLGSLAWEGLVIEPSEDSSPDDAPAFVIAIGANRTGDVR